MAILETVNKFVECTEKIEAEAEVLLHWSKKNKK